MLMNFMYIFNFRLIICDITEMPIGEGLETSLHPKRMRVWQPSRPQTAPTSAPTASAPSTPSGSSTMVSRESQSPVLVMPPSLAMFVECGLSGLSTPSGSSTMVLCEGPSPVLEMPPSPAMIVECGQLVLSTPSWSPMVRSCPRSRQNLNDNNIDFALHHGSDPSSDESDDKVVSPLIPRDFRSTLETPMDDHDVPPQTPTNNNTPATASTSSAVVDVASAETHQPNSFYQFDWKTFPNRQIPPESRRETFFESYGAQRK
ncbi:uncharacterized protein LOC111351157 isoform X2 [Spodoptera litura]|uniref:Uncharacterized protein LOC111351157 isoform X2 n=1 Tax=Spodoptera litura TaxID=69820 RepID=A0A9J7DYP8_SPOLT|nr:uncharacterized protein LOC111351157 isoform X2 [Spodoptera litura]